MFIHLFIYLSDSAVARIAALSRRCPVQDAVYYWKSPQEQAQEESVTG
jgi:hypothetical protein